MARQQQHEELDANEPATPFKLEKARERGSIVRSADLTFTFVMLACAACTYGLGQQVIDRTALLIRRGLSFIAHDEPNPAAALTYVHALSYTALTTIAPTLFVVWVVALVAAAAQARGVFTAHPLKPDFSRLNPANGFKRLFSARSLYELLRSSARLAAITIVMVIWMRHHLNELLRLGAGSPRSMIQGGLELLGSALLLLAGVIFIFALLEWLLNNWEFMRKMRMSRRELRDEHKEREGDPRIKTRLRQLRLEWLKRARQLAKVRSADVLLTNPTHYAVALEYRHGEMPAPMITARGAGDMAQRMRAEAHRHCVPVVENASLARSLFALGDSRVFVPEDHFEPVARVLHWVYAARGPRRPMRAFG